MGVVAVVVVGVEGLVEADETHGRRVWMLRCWSNIAIRKVRTEWQSVSTSVYGQYTVWCPDDQFHGSGASHQRDFVAREEFLLVRFVHGLSND